MLLCGSADPAHSPLNDYYFFPPIFHEATSGLGMFSAECLYHLLSTSLSLI